MKWYSVKEHEPILSECWLCIIVRKKATNTFYLELGEYNPWSKTWKDYQGKEIFDDNLEVSYFCYPDPIPKAYEKLIESQDKK